MANKVKFRLHNIGELLSWIDGQGETGKKAVKYTISDIKSRAPGWIASEAASVYNIKKSDINPSSTEESVSKKPASFVYISGETIESVSIVYVGRTLTPIHFSMSPRVPSRQRLKRKRAIPGSNIKFGNSVKYGGSKVGMVPIYKKYSIGMAVFKGSRWKIKGKRDMETPFLAPVKKGSDKYIVFQRKGKERTDMYSVRTLSVPQMLGNSTVQEKIDKRITEAVEQRLQHHLDRLAPKE